MMDFGDSPGVLTAVGRVLEDWGRWDGFGCGVWGRCIGGDFRRWATNMGMDGKGRWVGIQGWVDG